MRKTDVQGEAGVADFWSIFEYMQSIEEKEKFALQEHVSTQYLAWTPNGKLCSPVVETELLLRLACRATCSTLVTKGAAQILNSLRLATGVDLAAWNDGSKSNRILYYLWLPIEHGKSTFRNTRR